MYNLPERPLMLFPSLAKSLGVEAALLLGFYAERAQILGNPFCIEGIDLRDQLPFWNDQQILELTDRLSSAGVLRVNRSQGNLEISLAQTNQTIKTPAEQLPVRSLPVVDYGAKRQAQPSGPAPTFGGHSGWRRSPSELDEIFAVAEQRKKQLREMEVDWRPTQVFFELLDRSAITREFAEGCLDEFIAYYTEKGKAESNWDQRFLSWVKRAWREEETNQARTEKFNESSPAGNSHEKSRRDTRESRKRVTAAIMDIKNLDW